MARQSDDETAIDPVVARHLRTRLAVIAAGRDPNFPRDDSKRATVAQTLEATKALRLLGPEPGAPADGPPWIVHSLQDAATFFNRSPETIKEWRTKGCPGGRAQYDLSAMLQWRDTHLSGSSSSGGSSAPRSSADRRKALADAALKEMKVEQMRGQLVDVDDTAREARHFHTHARALLEQLPDRLLQFNGAESAAFLKEARGAVDGVVEVIHQHLQEMLVAVDAVIAKSNGHGVTE